MTRRKQKGGGDLATNIDDWVLSAETHINTHKSNNNMNDMIDNTLSTNNIVNGHIDVGEGFIGEDVLELAQQLWNLIQIKNDIGPDTLGSMTFTEFYHLIENTQDPNNDDAQQGLSRIVNVENALRKKTSMKPLDRATFNGEEPLLLGLLIMNLERRRETPSKRMLLPPITSEVTTDTNASLPAPPV